MFTTEEMQDLMQLMRTVVREELEPVNKRLDGVDKRLDGVDKRLDDIEESIEELKEYSEITRDVTNSIGEWIDFYFGDEKPYLVDNDGAVRAKN